MRSPISARQRGDPAGAGLIAAHPPTLGCGPSGGCCGPYVGLIARSKLRGSTGRVGACADNAAMESFFSLVGKNVLDRQRLATRQELRVARTTWIERTYHRWRRQRRLGRLTPIEYETRTTGEHAARTTVNPESQPNRGQTRPSHKGL